MMPTSTTTTTASAVENSSARPSTETLRRRGMLSPSAPATNRVAATLQISNGSDGAVFRRSGRGMSTHRRSTRLREGLVIAEVALACILLVFGGLLLKSFQNVLDVDLGFEPAEAVVWQVNAMRSFDSLAQANAFYDQVVTQVEAIPGVSAVGLTDAVPLGRNRTWSFGAPGLEYEGEPTLFAFPHIIDSRYLQTMEIPLVAGRYFTLQDTEERDRVVILNQTAAEAVYHGEDVLGRKVLVGGGESEVIGVVADIRHRSLEIGAGAQMYLPFTQSGDFGTLDMVVRSIGLILGVVASFAASRWVASLLYSVQPADPWTFLAMTVLLMLVAGLAGFLPALRASRTEAASVLRAS